MARRKGSSDYSSLPTDSESATSASSTDGEGGDIMIFYREASKMKDHVEDAMKILSNKYTVLDSFKASFDAGRLETTLQFNVAHKCAFKVFVINKSFLKHDAVKYSKVLGNPNVCMPRNTLFLSREIHRENIPKDYRHFPLLQLTDRLSGNEIASKINSFVEKQKGHGNLPVEADTSLRPLADEDLVKRKEYETKKGQFSRMVEKFDHRRYYFLCARIRPIDGETDYDPLSYIPWLKVFDFDSESESAGLLGAIKGKLHEGEFEISSTTELPKPLNDRVTNWTIVDSPDDFEQVRDRLTDHIVHAASFCAGCKPVIVLILYYQRDSRSELKEKLYDFVINLNLNSKQRTKFVLCLPEVPEDISDLSKLSRKPFVQDCRIIAPMQKICEWISDLKPNLCIQRETKVNRKLPKLKEGEGDDGTFNLQDAVFKWISVDLDVLASMEVPAKFEEDYIKQFGIEYLKGGELPWEILANGCYDVPRDICKDIINFIYMSHIEKGGCGIVTLFHSPGSDGTTVGRRVMWELRNKLPCLVLRQNTAIGEELKVKLNTIREKSNLPVLLLIDGRSAQEVKKILSMCNYERLIILHVCRFYSQIKKRRNQDGKFYLADSLSYLEAINFEKMYLKHGNPGIREHLNQLTEEVKNGKHRCVFEYGLTAFHNKYRGVGKYVESHLRLTHKTEPWQKVAAILSLTNYYGNISLPAEFFFEVLNKKGNDIVDFEDDIPEWGQHLIREYNDYYWKVSHYLVAKEILDQYLGVENESKSDTLLMSSTQNLYLLANDFLDCAKHHMGLREDTRGEFAAIVNTIFIVRHDKEVETDTPRKRLSFSRLITDLSDVEQQRKIFEKLVTYFPTNSEFHAHLGRFYSKANLHDHAVKAMENAVEIRKAALEFVGLDATKSGDEVLYRIQSMFGYAYKARIWQLIQNKNVDFLNREEYCSASAITKNYAYDIYQCANAAVEQFRKCREYYCPSVNPSYGIIGEIEVRLNVIEFCKKESENNLLAVANPRNEMHCLWKFVQESFTECDFLFDQCIAAEGENRYIQDKLTKYLNLFSDFLAQGVDFTGWAGDGKTLSSKRRHVALFKVRLKRGQRRDFQAFNDLKFPQEVIDLFTLLECVLDDKASDNIRVSPYMEECLRIVRYPVLHDKWPAEVLQKRVVRWCKRREKRSLGSFYNYVIAFVDALFNPLHNRAVIVDGYKQELEESLRSFPQNITKKPVEWLKQVPGAVRSPMIRLNHWQEPKRRLQVFRGHVIEARMWFGRIELEASKLSVHFVPRKFDINGYHAKEKRRVEFFIGFNLKHGAQAYDVKMAQS